MASTIKSRIIRDFSTQLYRTCGIRCIVLLAYQDEDGEIKAGMYVFQSLLWIYNPCTSARSDENNQKLDNGIDFTKFCPNWKKVPLWEKWSDYAEMSFGNGALLFPLTPRS
jgi:hypothetical protein